MTPIGHFVNRSRTWLAVLAACVACNSLFDIQKPKHEPVMADGTSACLLPSDCPSGQVCLFQICSPPCEKDVDCPGQRCLHSDSGTACVSALQAGCADAGQQCPNGTSCLDGGCYTSCSDAVPCVDDYDCVAGVCEGRATNGAAGASSVGDGGHGGRETSAGGMSEAAGDGGDGGRESSAGTSEAAGSGGAAVVDPCSACSKAQRCVEGVCVDQCTPANCAAGCCDENGNCVTTLDDHACGTQGASCGPCTGTNHCEQGACGCATSADCPTYQACQPNHTCRADCSASVACNGGCCDPSTSQCARGTGSTACGMTGACSSCAGLSSGTACEANGACGCNGPADCPVGTACNVGIHQCTISCAGGLVCSGTCCDGTNCQPGTTNAACGVATASCTACTAVTTCQNKACSAACSTTTACAGGGCCQNSTCVAPTSNSACGPSCTDCASNAHFGATVGPFCINGACGCRTSADCNPGLACNQTSHQCSASCDGVTNICNTGCCSSAGLCVAGTSNSAAGYNGEKCQVCSSACYKDATGNCATSPYVVKGGATCLTGKFPTDSFLIDCGSSDPACAGPEGLYPVPLSYNAPNTPGADFICTCGCVDTKDCPAPSTKCVNNLCQP